MPHHRRLESLIMTIEGHGSSEHQHKTQKRQNIWKNLLECADFS